MKKLLKAFTRALMVDNGARAYITFKPVELKTLNTFVKFSHIIVVLGSITYELALIWPISIPLYTSFLQIMDFIDLNNVGNIRDMATIYEILKIDFFEN